MKRESMKHFLFFILAIVVVAGLTLLFNTSDDSTFTGHVVFETQGVADCTEDSVLAVWKEVMHMSSDGLEISLDNATQAVCSYSAYTINEDTLSYIVGESNSSSSAERVETILAFSGSFNESFLSTLGSNGLSASTLLSYTLDEDSYAVTSPYALAEVGVPRNESASELLSRYATLFKANTFEWGNTSLDVSGDDAYVSYEDTEANGTQTLFLGASLKAYTQDFFVLKSICTPDWVPQDTSCVNDSAIRSYSDVNSCGTVVPENTSVACDSEGDAVIGTLSDVDGDLFVNGTAFNDTFDYSSEGVVPISLMKDSQDVLTFTWNFSSPLNLKELQIQRGASSEGEGYVLVNGLSIQKNVTLSKVSDASNSVCVKDAEISSLSDFSEDCLGSDDETLVSCPGSATNADNVTFTCDLSSDETSYVVSGLMHSGVLEIVPVVNNNDDDDNDDTSNDNSPSTSETECTGKRTCPEWDTVQCINDVQTRTCTIIGNGCKKFETEKQACGVDETSEENATASTENATDNAGITGGAVTDVEGDSNSSTALFIALIVVIVGLICSAVVYANKKGLLVKVKALFKKHTSDTVN